MTTFITTIKEVAYTIDSWVKTHAQDSEKARTPRFPSRGHDDFCAGDQIPETGHPGVAIQPGKDLRISPAHSNKTRKPILEVPQYIPQQSDDGNARPRLSGLNITGALAASRGRHCELRGIGSKTVGGIRPGAPESLTTVRGAIPRTGIGGEG